MTDTPQDDCCRTNRALLALVVAASVLAVATAVAQTQVAWFQNHDEGGFWHVRVWDMSTALLPVSVLLFAFGVQWALRRRAALAAAALLPLPAWTACLLLWDNLLSRDVFAPLILAPLAGIKPFGAP